MSRKEDALHYHQQGRAGKIEVVPTKPLNTQRDLSLAYSPGVAEPCREIEAEPERAWQYTARGNLVAVITNGTAVLGLGDIGPLAGKPVMEGKACLFKKFADVDVFDLEIAEKDPGKFIEVVAALEPTFGGINLEDIGAPQCFEIEARLRERLSIPVFHDDQHGTAIIAGAALLNACEVAGKHIDRIKMVVSGAGAAAIACITFFLGLGLRRENVIVCDSKGVVHDGRKDLDQYKQLYATRDDGRRKLAEVMRGADMFLGLSIGNVVSREMLMTMADRPIVFALANPDPEIAYAEAMEARPDALMATGRSDYPNQVNNVLGFPYIFRGALDVRARRISEEMKLAAARALAELAHEPIPESVISAYGDRHLRFGPEYLIPTPFDERVLFWVAPAVARAAMESGVARASIDIEEYRESLRRRVGGASYGVTKNLMAMARRDPKRIVYPEAHNGKILRAAQIVVDEGIAQPILVGDPERIRAGCERAKLDLLARGVAVIDPLQSERAAAYAQELYRLRQRKGLALESAQNLVRRSDYFGMMMVKLGEADGLVSGLRLHFPETIKPALQIFGRDPEVQVASGMYMMVLKESVRFFTDPTINIEPNASTLADIAISAADAVTELGITPRVAMVSFSNFGSVEHPLAERVRQALVLIRHRRPQLEVEGEMQADFALNQARLQARYPFARLADGPNVLVFPDLMSANAAYKVLETAGGAGTLGPLLLGVNAAVSVLQAQAPVNDIVNITAYTVMRAQQRAGRARSLPC
jgi:malate dehydrogenase (oxaloacetate-decarboxylating)(NADP+)